MSVGNPIGEGSLQVSGPVGAVYAFDLSNQSIEKLQRVLVLDDATNASDILTADAGLTALLAMPFDTAAADAATAQVGSTVYVFVKTAVYAVDIHTRVAFWMQSSAPVMASIEGTLSIPATARTLLAALIDELEADGRPDFFQSEGVRRERAELGL